MPVARVNGKLLSSESGRIVRAIHYGDKTWYLEDIDFTVTVENNQVTITGYTGSDTDVAIPSTIYGYPVVCISTKAFINKTSLTSIEIPDSVTSISENAFRYCTGLTSVKLGSGVTTIGDYAFSKCTNLTSIEIPDSVTSIGMNAFSECVYLTDVRLSENLKTIENNTFYRCVRLSNITIPDSVETIDYGAFESCNNLESVTLSNNLKTIGNGAFKNCDKLFTVEIPSSVETLGDLVFKVYPNSNDTVNFVYVFNSTEPPTIGETLFLTPSNSNQSLTIQVPSGYGNTYKTWNTYWRVYDEYIVEAQTGYTLTFNVESYIWLYDYYFYSLDSGSTWNAIDSATMTIENLSKIRFKVTTGIYGIYIGTSSGSSDIANVGYESESETEDIAVTADATWYFTRYGGGSGA